MVMKKFRYSHLTLLTTILLLSCDNDDVNVKLNPESDLSFSGTFKTIDSENVSGTVTLRITNGYYSSSTNLPFGQGAGKIKIQKSTINFIDTLFFPIPAIYGPSYVLSGQHQYKFDGDNLKIWRTKNVGDIEYNLNLKK
jgi:hypothetical protein